MAHLPCREETQQSVQRSTVKSWKVSRSGEETQVAASIIALTAQDTTKLWPRPEYTGTQHTNTYFRGQLEGA